MDNIAADATGRDKSVMVLQLSKKSLISGTKAAPRFRVSETIEAKRTLR
jgi:hypothetical protein